MCHYVLYLVSLQWKIFYVLAVKISSNREDITYRYMHVTANTSSLMLPYFAKKCIKTFANKIKHICYQIFHTSNKLRLSEEKGTVRIGVL